MKRKSAPMRAIVLAAIMVASLLAASPGSASGQVHPGGVTSEDLAQDLDWQPCYPERTAETGVVFECAELTAPRDYDEVDLDTFGPDGDDTLTVALVRIPAGDPANRQGAILANPGGPGGSGISFVLGFGPFAGAVFGPDVPAQFDLVGFDPRGIGQSTPVRCFDTIDEAVQVFPPTAFPLTRDEENLFRDANRALADACSTYPGARDIAEHVSTANVARDMDVIRASMGDESLNFIGLSYGTYIVANYANLFPDRVRSVVADGVLDPVAWVNREGRIPFSTRLRSDFGAAVTLLEFFEQCEAAAPGNCAFAPNSFDRYEALARKLRFEGPIDLPNPVTGDTTPFTYQDLAGFSLGNLYDPFAYADMALGLAFFEAVAFGGDNGEPAPAAPQAALAFMEEEPYENFVEGFPSVGCVDTTNPRSYQAYRNAASAAEVRYGPFGPIWTWASSPCIEWPFQDEDRYTGPFTAETANPVLVIGNFYDPATRYEGAQKLRSLLPNSGLLSVDVPGHTSLGLSACAGGITGQYFLDPATAVAVDGFTCPAEFNAFDAVAPAPAAAAPQAQAAAADAGTMVEVRAAVMEEIGTLLPVSAGR